MLDDMLDYVAQIRDRPVWQPAPDTSEAQFRKQLPSHPKSLAEVHATFLEHVLPYAVGNAHPALWAGSTVEAPRSACWPKC